MKLNFGRRLVLFINWLLSLAGCALMVTLIVWPKCMETVLSLLERQELAFKVYAVAVLAVYLIFAVGAICIIFGSKKKREKNAFIVVDSSETGRTRIAVSAVDQMIRQAVRGVDGIADLKANIVNNEDSIAIAADVAILNGAHVPTVTANIQRAIRGYIEHNCGVPVRGVSVSVHSLAEAEDYGKCKRKKKTEVVSYAKPTMVGNDSSNYGKSDWGAPNEPAAQARQASKSSPADVPEMAVDPMPKAAPVEAPVEVDFPAEDEPIKLTLDPEPEAPAEEAADAETAEEGAPAAEEVPAAEDAPPQETAPAQKKRLFGKLFGKREESAASDESGSGSDGEA